MILAGLTPAAVGLLTGAREAGYAGSAGVYSKLADRGFKDADEMRKIKLARIKKGNDFDKFKMQEDYRQTGRKELIGVRDKFQGDRQERFGSGKIKGTDALGNIGVINKATGEFNAVGGEDSFQGKAVSPRLFKRADKVISEFNTNYKEDRKLMASLDRGEVLLDSGNPTAIVGAIKEIAKAAEGGGKLTDFDYEMFASHPSWVLSGKERAYLEAKGKHHPEVISRMKGLIRMMKNQMKPKLDSVMDKIAGSESMGNKWKKDYFMGRMGGYKPTSTSMPQKEIKSMTDDEIKKELGL